MSWPLIGTFTVAVIPATTTRPAIDAAINARSIPLPCGQARTSQALPATRPISIKGPTNRTKCLMPGLHERHEARGLEAGPRLGGSHAIAQERAGHETGANDGGNLDNCGQHDR